MATVVVVSESELVEPPDEKMNNSSNAAAAALALSSSSPVPWPAAVADRYERLQKLGQGMFGEVYKAWDRVSERFVAVKRLSAGRTDDDDRFVTTPFSDFAREAKSLAACHGHPSVVQVLATYADCCGRADGDGDCFVVTEYAGPMNLRQYMRRLNGQSFDEGEVRDVMAQLLAGARHAHAAGVLHRDIVPENVVVDMGDDRMLYRICGFGMSAAAAADKDDDSGMLASPSPYRAPELFLGSKDYDGRVDTWSLGCIMAELVAGTGGVPFFGAPDDGEVFKKMMQVVGTDGIVEWQGLERLLPPEKVTFLWEMGRQEGGGHLQLQDRFPPAVLSPAGFKVLEGLLHSNPDRRLSAAAALRMPWFRRRRCLFGAWCFRPHYGVAP